MSKYTVCCGCNICRTKISTFGSSFYVWKLLQFYKEMHQSSTQHNTQEQRVRGDHFMEGLQRWLNEEVGLSKHISNFEKDFANGYFFGEIFSRFNLQVCSCSTSSLHSLLQSLCSPLPNFNHHPFLPSSQPSTLLSSLLNIFYLLSSASSPSIGTLWFNTLHPQFSCTNLLSLSLSFFILYLSF